MILLCYCKMAVRLLGVELGVEGMKKKWMKPVTAEKKDGHELFCMFLKMVSDVD